jgi:hypothetical protein
MGDERESTEQSALPPAFYRCPAALGWGGQTTLGGATTSRWIGGVYDVV